MFPGASADRMTCLKARLFASCCYSILHTIQTKESTDPLLGLKERAIIEIK